MSHYIHPEIIALQQAFHGIEAVAHIFEKHGIPVLATSYKIEPDQEDQARNGWSLHHDVASVERCIDVSYNVYREHAGIGYQALFDVRSELLDPSTDDPGTNIVFSLEYIVATEDRKIGGRICITDDDSAIGHAFLRNTLELSRREFEKISTRSSNLDEHRFLTFLERIVQRLAPIITCNQSLPQIQE
ncbi:MAG: hypothetical protein KIH65_002115 [Candidatus Uhrbacteria bacterium]|nr:hypothetical protein [Candidatus Uhrbacteria bacterium]